MMKNDSQDNKWLSWLISTHKSRMNDLKSSLHHYISYVNNVYDDDTNVYCLYIIDFSII